MLYVVIWGPFFFKLKINGWIRKNNWNRTNLAPDVRHSDWLQMYATLIGSRCTPL